MPAELTRAGVGTHRVAVLDAYELIEQVQLRPCDGELDRLQTVAVQHRWHDVEFLVHYARFAGAEDGGADGAPHAHRMLDAARRCGDDVLLGAALAARACLAAVSGEQVDQAAGARDLARAVALIEASAVISEHAPLAYVECAMAYTRQDLWELAIEMNDRARALVVAPNGQFVKVLGPRYVDLYTSVTRSNLLESAVPLACMLVEIGERDQARLVAADRVGPSPTALAALPSSWAQDMQATDSLLAAIAGQGEPVAASWLLDRLEPTIRQRYRAMTWLSCAIRAVDAGELGDAAAAAEIALQHEDGDQPVAVRSLALHLAAVNDPAAFASRRYSRELAVMRWRARLSVLHAAQAGLESERLMLENRRLSERAYVDELTGLANRHAYSRYLERVRTATERHLDAHALVVLMVDVDHFKEVNDTFGHAVGDEVLRRLGGLLGQAMRVSDFAVRLGGDEFLLLLVGGSPLDVDERGRYLVEAVRAHPWRELAADLEVTVSVGVAVGQSRQVDELVAAADRGLYQAKATGRDRAAHERTPTQLRVAPVTSHS